MSAPESDYYYNALFKRVYRKLWNRKQNKTKCPRLKNRFMLIVYNKASYFDDLIISLYCLLIVSLLIVFVLGILFLHFCWLVDTPRLKVFSLVKFRKNPKTEFFRYWDTDIKPILKYMFISRTALISRFYIMRLLFLTNI